MGILKVLAVLMIMLMSRVGSCTVVDPTWYASEDGELCRKGGGNEEQPLQTGRRLKPISFSPSDSGFLMYLEPTPAYSLHRLGPFVTPQPGVKYLTPGTIVHLLHVCDANLKDKVVVPIRVDGGWNEAYFHGENVIVLETNPRWGELVDRTVVNLATKDVFFSDKVTEFGVISFKSISPDGRTIITSTYHRKSDQMLYFLNSALLYPYFDDDTGFFDYSGNEAKLGRMRDNLSSIRTGKLVFMNDNSWSPDSRYVAGLEQQPGPSTATVNQATVLVVDTIKLQETRDLQKSSLRQPCLLSPQAIQGRLPCAEFVNGDQNRLVITKKSNGYSESFEQIVLPPDWKSRIERK